MADLHSAEVEADLHEPKGVNGADAQSVYVADGAGSGNWTENDIPDTTVKISYNEDATQYYKAASTGADAYDDNIPVDNTIPQDDEGVEAISVTYTPKFKDSILYIEGNVNVFVSGNLNIHVVSLFSDKSANAISAISGHCNSALIDNVNIHGKLVLTSIDDVVFSIRAGSDGISHLGINRTTSQIQSLLKSTLIITEVRP